MTLAAIANLGATHTELGNHSEALALLTEAVARYRRSLGDSHPNTLLAMQAHTTDSPAFETLAED